MQRRYSHSVLTALLAVSIFSVAASGLAAAAPTDQLPYAPSNLQATKITLSNGQEGTSLTWIDNADNEAGFGPGLERSSTFVANWTNDAVALGGNRLADGIAASDRR